ncbi:MAG: hypothetical protein JXP34_24245 [Planctomycetes bacterium]|nr:hypothetical protein [Planctomycetota bacterium]
MNTTRYGNFSGDGKEFILIEPLLDRPWMNVLSNGTWAYLASHLGGGYSFLRDPTVGRITRWHIDGVPRDTTGKFIYLRDEESGEWWCANGFPPTRRLEAWSCHIGLGYNRIVSAHRGIGSEILYFCPMPAPEDPRRAAGDPCLIWRVALTNLSLRPRRISATSYVEFALGNWFEDTSWREFTLLFNRQAFRAPALYTRSTMWVRRTGGWQACNSDANNIEFDREVFLASSAEIDGHEGDRYAFIGSYRDLRDPQAMDATRLRDAVSAGRDACAALRHRFALEPGDRVEFVLLLGAAPRGSGEAEGPSAEALFAKYLSPEKADAAFSNLRRHWDAACRRPAIATPDPDLDLLVNTWFPYQAANLAWWNRNVGYCYSGIYGFGIRDACQDAVCRLPEESVRVRDDIAERIMIWQFEEGDYAHTGDFGTMTGGRTFHSDDPINPAFLIARYVRETGDFSILDEVTPYAHTGGAARDTIYDHVIRGLEFFFSRWSERGLPLILKADWNDALDQMGSRGRGDSGMLACWAILCIRDFFPCMEYRKDLERLADYRARLDRLAERVNAVAWDGDWYQRAMHDDGWILGTKENRYGRIWSNPNAFAIVSGVADEERRERIYRAFERHLDCDLGSRTFWPPFAEPDPRAGIISRFAPGTKENGSIFGHSSRWRIWAECAGGRGDKAYAILRAMLPTTRHGADPDTYRVEPYVACQFIYGPESDRPGEGSHAWATGTAAWTLIVVREHILGVRPEIQGLRIDPCLPSAWTRAGMTRSFRGAVYEIEIEKDAGISKGAVEVAVDGVPLATNLIPPHGDGRRHRVKVAVRRAAPS